MKSRASDTLAVFLAGTTGEEAARGSARPRPPPRASSSIARRADPRALENPRGGGGVVFLAGTIGEEAAGGSALPRAPPLASSSIARRADPRALETQRGGGGGADGRPRGGRRVVD